MFAALSGVSLFKPRGWTRNIKVIGKGVVERSGFSVIDCGSPWDNYDWLLVENSKWEDIRKLAKHLTKRGE